ncbi:MAG: hypothetical protein Q9207_001045 [Kuettlingeria erythrocarpa]
MDFVNNAEDPKPAPKAVVQPVPAQPFPFLKLPREIRDFIYYHALVRPGTDPDVEPARICYMHHKASSRHVSNSYWGTEKSTRLFRVNRQVYGEASEVFYSTFPFHFPSTVDRAMVNGTLGVLNVRARRLVRRVGFMLLFRSIPSPFTAKDDSKNEGAIEAVTELLPNIKQVEATIAFIGHDVPDSQITEVVKRILKILAPLKDIPGLTIRGGGIENKQRSRILNDVREALTCP